MFLIIQAFALYLDGKLKFGSFVCTAGLTLILFYFYVNNVIPFVYGHLIFVFYKYSLIQHLELFIYALPIIFGLPGNSSVFHMACPIEDGNNTILQQIKYVSKKISRIVDEGAEAMLKQYYSQRSLEAKPGDNTLINLHAETTAKVRQIALQQEEYLKMHKKLAELHRENAKCVEKCNSIFNTTGISFKLLVDQGILQNMNPRTISFIGYILVDLDHLDTKLSDGFNQEPVGDRIRQLNNKLVLLGQSTLANIKSTGATLPIKKTEARLGLDYFNDMYRIRMFILEIKHKVFLHKSCTLNLDQLGKGYSKFYGTFIKTI